MLAGVSAEYYVRLKRGRDRNPSEQVLDALARVLGLEQESRDYVASPVASLRGSAADQLDNPRLIRLVGELPLKSPDFDRLWARHDVRAKTNGTKRIHSPTVGEVTVTWEGLALTSTPGQLLVTYLAEPGTGSNEKLQRVAALAADYDDAVVTLEPSS